MDKLIKNELIENEFGGFLWDIAEDAIEAGALQIGKFFDERDYEDEYSHDFICKAQIIFMKKVKEYLREHCPGKYVVMLYGKCVFIMSPQAASEDYHLSKRKIEMFIV